MDSQIAAFQDKVNRVADSFGNVVSKEGTNMLSDAARLALHTVIPEDYEYYMCGFELVDHNNITQLRFLFPVMPNQMVINEKKISNIIKTANGIVTLVNPSFVPKSISLAGTFGRKIRVQVANNLMFDTISAKGNFVNSLDSAIHNKPARTGYGYTKLLEKIYEQSTRGSSGGIPYKLLFHNFAFGSVHFVEMESFQASQTMETNMMWTYNLQMKAVAPKTTIAEVLAGAPPTSDELQEIDREQFGSQSLGGNI